MLKQPTLHETNYLGTFLCSAVLALLSACGGVPLENTGELEQAIEEQAQVSEVLVSTAARRSSPTFLDAAEVSGTVYIYIEPEGVSQVGFYLNDAARNGTPYRTESKVPFDLGGTASDGTARGFDTRALKDGVNTLTAAVHYSDGAYKVVTATFLVVNSPGSGFSEALLLSRSSKRLDAVPLNEQKVNGAMYVFLVASEPAPQVDFYLDGNHVQRERQPFFDFTGTESDGTARAFDASALSGGKHSLRAVITRTSGSRDEVTATFSVGDAAPAPTEPSGIEPLQVSSNGRYLQTASGKPLFLLADTMWALPTLSEAEVDLYFKTRKEQGFNAILGPVVWGSHNITPSGYMMDDPIQVDDPFYRHLDMLVAKAKKYGLYLGMVVQWGEADRMSKYESPQEAYDYGRFIGNRYREEPHLFWFGSGEYTLAEEAYADYYEAVSRGVKDAVGSNQLVTIHPAGGQGYAQQSSSYLFHDASWLDFNSIQTWKTDTSTFKKVKDDWRLSPTKPVFMSETKYEGEGSDAFRMRRLAYWSTFSGSLGFGYGHGDVWSGKRDGKDWQGALQAPGANDMRHLANLIRSRSKTPTGAVIYFDHRPDDSVIKRVDGGSNPSDASTRGHVAAMRDRNGKYFMVYIPTETTSRSLEVDMSKIAGSKAKAWWYSPSSGSSSAIGTYDASGSRTFKTPSTANDWVLVVDDASYQWAVPGQ